MTEINGGQEYIWVIICIDFLDLRLLVLEVRTGQTKCIVCNQRFLMLTFAFI